MSGLMPVMPAVSFMPGLMAPQEDVAKLYELQESVWAGRDRNGPATRQEVRDSLDQAIRNNEALIQPVMQKVLTDTYDNMINKGMIPAERKPQSDELSMRLATALTMLLDSNDLERWLKEKPLKDKLRGSEVEYVLRLSQNVKPTQQWLA